MGTKGGPSPAAGFAVVGGLWALAMANATRYTGFYSDDAFISLRYARRLLDGHGLTWTDGEWVEGYSNLLWILMTATLGALGVDLVIATRVLGTAALLGLIAAVSAGPRGLPDWRRAAGGGAFVAFTATFGIWAMAGLSQTFVSMLAVLAIVVARRARDDPRALALLTVLMAVTTLNRIDGFVLCAAVLVGAVAGGLPVRRAGVAALGSAVAWLAQFGFRLLYYGDWVPNTARVKVSFTLNRAWIGTHWVLDGLLAHWVLVAVAAVAIWIARRRAVDGLVAALGWLAFTAYVGGDIFIGWRLILPALALLTLVVADGASALARRDARWVAVLAGLALVHGVWNVDAGRNGTATQRHWVFWTTGPAGALREHFAEHDPLLAVDAAGSLPFHTGFRAVDMLGLTDRWLAMNPPPGWGGTGLGHDLGNGGYIWRRKPDLIAFRSGIGGEPLWLSGRQLVRRPQWKRMYRPVVFAGPADDGKLQRGLYFVRTRDSALGMQEDPKGITIPGWFFGTHQHPTRLKAGVLGPIFPKGQHKVRFPAPKGRWRMKMEGDGVLHIAEPVVKHEGGMLVISFRVDEPTQIRSLRLRRRRR